MRQALAWGLLGCSSAAIAQPGYSPLPFSGGEVAIHDASNTLKDWRSVEGAPSQLLVHDRTGQWYLVKLGRADGCTFKRDAPIVGAYGTDFQHMFGPGMWVQNASYPYKQCLVHSTRPAPTPADQVGVDYANEYLPTSYQVVAHKVHCLERMDSIWTRPLASDKKLSTLCN